MSGSKKGWAVLVASIKGGTFYFNFKYRPTAEASLFERETISHRHALPMIRNLHNSLSDLISAILLLRNENPPIPRDYRSQN